MRVVILADFAEPSGGAQRVALESARALAESGVDIAYLHAIGDEGDPLLEHPLIERVGFGLKDVWDLPVVTALPGSLWNASAAKRLRRFLTELPPGPTVIHVHQWTRAFSPAALSVCLRSGLPVAVTLHDYFLACPNGVYYRSEKDEPCDVRPLSLACVTAPCDPRSRLHKAVRTLRTAITDGAIRNRSFDVIHVSDRGRDTIARFLPATVRHHRVDNPVSIARREPASPRRDARIAYIGRLTREKGADLLAEATRDADLPVLFVGEGPLATEIARINPAAELLGWQSPERVGEMLRGEIRAVAAPSRWFETGPLTVYEAAAAGIPAIVSNRAGASEKVEHGETGFVVEPNAISLAAALMQLADSDTAKRLGGGAYERFWAAPPTPRAHASWLLEVYSSMLGLADRNPPS